MQPLGLGMPPILAASLAGPLGKSWYSSLMGTPDSLPSERIEGGGARREVALAHELDDEPVPVSQLGDAVLGGDRLGDLLVPLLGVGEEALGVDVDRGLGDQGHGHLVLLSGVNRGSLLAGGRHRRPDAGNLAAGQQGMPVDPLERELAQVVEPRLTQQRQPERGGEVAGSGSVS